MTRTPPSHLLITGGAGFIGSHFVDLALKNGLRVTVLDALTYAGQKDHLRMASNLPGYSFVHGTILDRNLVSQLLSHHPSIDAVVHFAAESHVDRSINGPDAFLKTNVEGTHQLLRASLEYWEGLPREQKNQFRFLQVSTDEVFGSLGPFGFFSETSAYDPRSPYSASKAAADHFVRAYHHTFGLPTLITHCSNNYGPRQFPEKLIPTMIHQALLGQPLPVYGDGQNIRDWIHVSDHCQGVLQALRFGSPGQSYCMGGQSERTNLEVVRLICDYLDLVQPRADGCPYHQQIQFVTDRLGHDRRYAIDDQKAKRELGFKRTQSFEQGLQSTIDWYLNHRDWMNTVLQTPKMSQEPERSSRPLEGVLQ